MKHAILILMAASAFAEGVASAQETETRERRFVEIAPTDEIPSVRAILPLDAANVFFLNDRGQVGVAKFSPGLSQIGWTLYSEVSAESLPYLALGPKYSILTASPTELTQAFDTDQDLKIDFFQSVLRDWPDRDKGVVITAGPVADAHGRVLFALSPHALAPDTPVKARLMGWNPKTGKTAILTESELPIDSFALSRENLLAARLSMPDYKDGFFLSLTDLPPPTAEDPDAQPDPMPFTLPSLILPAELTKGESPGSPAFVHEGEQNRLLLVAPASGRILEVAPERRGPLWQGSILLRGISPKSLLALAEPVAGSLLGGGAEGFFPLETKDDEFRIRGLRQIDEGLAIDFNQPVDRFEAIKPENFSLRAISLGGGDTTLIVDPMVESTGRTVILRTRFPDAGYVLRLVCQKLPSEGGKNLLSPSAFYSVHQ